MLDPDISTEDAKYLLSAPAMDGDSLGPLGWSRRTFLQAVGMGVFGGMAVGSLGEGLFGDIPEAWAGTPIGPTDGILVVIVLYGGNDGLNTLVPFTDPAYQTVRSNIAIPAASLLPLDSSHGLHPELGYLKGLYDAGQMAVVQGVGYANPDLSHFTSMGIWMNGRLGGGSGTGWIGRWLDGQPAATADLTAASIDTSVPLHMVGAVRRAVAVTPGELFGTSMRAEDKRMYAGIRGMSSASAGRGQWHDAFATTMTRQLDVAADVAPAFAATLPPRGLTKKLAVTARLINANIGMRVFDVGLDGFDNHEQQPVRHTNLLRDLNLAVETFYATLAPEYRSRVTLMTMSEFGRTPSSNSSLGTDHGTAAPLFVIGQNVKGGLYGAAPSLTALDRNRRLIANVDFRSVYGTVIDGWMGGGGSTIVNGNFQNLGFFQSGPGGAPGEPSAPVTVTPTTASTVGAAGFVPMSPLRAFDTRDGTGGRVGALGAGESWDFTFAGQFGIPTGTVAVAVNLTSVDASAPTFVTAWPTGQERPFTANLNPVPGMAVPNLVVGRLGAGGALSLYNNSGSVHLVGDIVGYFSAASNVGLVALTPARLLDTRDGTGAAAPGPIGEGHHIDLKVAGRGGVPDNVAAVALNVTVTQPTTGSYLTVFPTGETRPLAASVNMVRGQTVPNMVLARVKDGHVSIYNNSGSTHVVADVLGCFTEGAGKYVAVTPARVLDTREGLGAPQSRVGQTPVELALAGAAGIPTSGVSAVLLNVTAVSPSAGTYITVYPTGGDRPLAANLNAQAGQIVPNMVIGRLGPDGKVAIFNFAGNVDLVADVMGYFT